MTERVPFVITCKKWKNLYEQKENAKRTIEKEKETRKRLREENKILKINKQTKTSKQRVVKNLFPGLHKNKKPETVTSQTINSNHFEDTYINDNINEDYDLVPAFESNIFNSTVETGCCVSCDNEIINSDLGVECQFCNNKYHQRCTSNDSYDDIFICQICEKSVIVN